MSGTKQGLSVRQPDYRLDFDLDAGAWELAAGPGRRAIRLQSNQPLLLMPEIAGAFPVSQSLRIEHDGATPSGFRRIVLSARMSGSADVMVTNEIELMDNRLTCSAHYATDEPHSLAHWMLAPAGSRTFARAVHAYVGLHGEDGNGTIVAAPDASIDTATHNWSYSSLAPRLLLLDGGLTVGLSGTSPANDFGLQLECSNGVIDYLRFNYGGRERPLRLTGGMQGPRLQICVTEGKDHHASHRTLTDAMIADGIVTAPSALSEAWRRPWYCTWGDQMEIARGRLRQDVGGMREYGMIKEVLTQSMVLETARMIREERINIGTIIIDDGWQDYRGDWNLDTGRFPDMRALTDALHEMGFNVVLWWAPFLTEPGAAVLRSGLIAEKTPAHSEIVLDYTKSGARRWLKEKLQLWCGKRPGEWNIDGFKLDFLQEKVYPQKDTGDVEWRGGERLFRNLFGEIHRAIAHSGKGAGIASQLYNPHVMACHAALIMEERFDEDLSYLGKRVDMAEALSPGTALSPHFNYNSVMVPDFLRAVREIGGIPQIGKIIAPSVTGEIRRKIREELNRWL